MLYCLCEKLISGLIVAHLVLLPYMQWPLELMYKYILNNSMYITAISLCADRQQQKTENLYTEQSFTIWLVLIRNASTYQTRLKIKLSHMYVHKSRKIFSWDIRYICLLVNLKQFEMKHLICRDFISNVLWTLYSYWQKNHVYVINLKLSISVVTIHNYFHDNDKNINDNKMKNVYQPKM